MLLAIVPNAMVRAEPDARKGFVLKSSNPCVIARSPEEACEMVCKYNEKIMRRK